MEHTDFGGALIWIIILFVIFVVLPAIYCLIKGPTHVPSKTKVWTCETCGAKLKSIQIKFGLCPICRQKVKKFRGHYRSICGM